MTQVGNLPRPPPSRRTRAIEHPAPELTAKSRCPTDFFAILHTSAQVHPSNHVDSLRPRSSLSHELNYFALMTYVSRSSSFPRDRRTPRPFLSAFSRTVATSATRPDVD